MNPTDQNHNRIALTVRYYLAFCAVGLVVTSLGPTLPGLAEHTSSTLAQISILFTTRAAGYLVGSLIGGPLFDRGRGNPLMAGSILAMAVMMAAMPFIPQLWLLAAAMLVLGLGEGVADVGANTLLIWTHGSAIGPFLNGMHFFFGVGALVSPLIIAQAIQRTGDISWAYWVLAALCLPVVISLFITPSPAVPTRPAGQQSSPANALLVVLISLLLFLYVGAEVSFGGWIYTYGVELHLADKVTAAYLTSIFWAALTTGRLISIPIGARFSPRSVILVDLLGALAAMLLLLSNQNSYPLLIVSTVLLGLCMASIFPSGLNLATRTLHLTGKVTSYLFVGASAGAMSVPWLIGQLFESYGPHSTMIAVFIALVVALGVILLISALIRRPATTHPAD